MQMAKVNILTLTGQVTKENGKMVKDMEKGFYLFLMEESISGNGIWEDIKIKESLSHLTVSRLKENSIMVSLKVKEYVHGLIEMNMLGN